MLEIAPMVEPVLSFTGSPTESAAAAEAPAVALLSAAEPEVEGVDVASGGVVVCELAPLDCIGASVAGTFDAPAEVWLAARA